jgi:uncharacterized membrane protein YccC
MVFWITIILGLMFGLLGYFPADLLLLRLEEAAAGAASGAVVASLVLVRREFDAIRDATAGFLNALGGVVRGAATALLSGQPAADLGPRTIASEQAFHDLSAMAQSQLLGVGGARNEDLHRRMLLLEACELWARELAQMGLQSVRIDTDHLAANVREIAGRIDAMIAGMTKHSADQHTDARPVEMPDGGPRLDLHDDQQSHAVRLLLRIESALIKIGALAAVPA